MRAAGRALRIAPAGMTPPVTGEGRAYDIERGQFDHLTRIRDEEPGSTPGYSALSTTGSARRRAGDIATHRFQWLAQAAFILLI